MIPWKCNSFRELKAGDSLIMPTSKSPSQKPRPLAFGPSKWLLMITNVLLFSQTHCFQKIHSLRSKQNYDYNKGPTVLRCEILKIYFYIMGTRSRQHTSSKLALIAVSRIHWQWVLYIITKVSTYKAKFSIDQHLFSNYLMKTCL